MAALATPADLCKRFDVRLLGDLVGDDDVRVEPDDLLTDDNLQAAIDDAWGEILGALLMSKRYSEADLAALTAESKQFLIRINCLLALGNLFERRPWSDDDQRVHATDKADRARKELDALRTGSKVLNLEAQQDAGLPALTTTTVTSVKQASLMVDEARRGFYMSRRFGPASA